MRLSLTAKRALLAALLACVVATPSRAQDEPVDLLLVLATDTSSSVFQEKLMRQRADYAAALTSPAVLRAVRSGRHRRIAVSYVEWSGEEKQKTLVPWMIVDGPLAASAFSIRMRELFRSFSGGTAIGAAIDYCVELIERSPYQAERAVIDITGDGTNNGTRDVQQARDDAVDKGIIINGLPTPRADAISWDKEHTSPPGGLTNYYFTHVVGGPGSFVLASHGFPEFRHALIRKLVAEIAAR